MQKKIGLIAAILININIIVGAGVFLNVKPLTALSGSLGFLGYPLSSLILLPFVLTLGKLAQKHPVSGGLYVYSKEYINRFAGFLSGWSYFVGKAVSSAFLVFAFVQFLQSKLPIISSISTSMLAIGFIFSLIFLNILGIHIGGNIQFLFILIKASPLLFVIFFGLSFFQPNLFNLSDLSFSPMLSTVPIAIFALLGFETTCAIGHMIDNPKKNTLRIILISFFAVIITYTFFLAIIFGTLGDSIPTYTSPFRTFAQITLYSYPLVGKVLNAFIFTSALIGSFGILTSNCWNLHALAEDNLLPGKKWLLKRSRSGAPWVSLLLEGTIAAIMLAISRNQIALQSMAVFGVVTAFLLSAIAAYKASACKASGKDINIARYIPMLAIASCSYILLLCVQQIYAAGVSFSFIILFMSGIGIAICKNSYKSFFYN